MWLQLGKESRKPGTAICLRSSTTGLLLSAFLLGCGEIVQHSNEMNILIARASLSSAFSLNIKVSHGSQDLEAFTLIVKTQG